ncbi:hypothetical protein BDR26DRAFT_868276 [Obelidium mucronatum]|nr:hypothetical protein BDR26DRAFT_868276 [Obelidium mucronatum]
MAEAALLECSHLYMALLEALVPIKFGRSALLQARVNGVFPFLDKAITGERVHSHLLEHIGNPRKVGTSIPPLPEALRIDAESFIAPPESIFSLRETELLYTVEMAVDEILCDESLLNQFQPYLELYASLLTPEAMLEPFFDYLSSKDLLATVLAPSSRNTNPFGNAQTGTQYDNMFSVSTASPFYSPQNTTTGTSAPADSRSESETANRPVADVMSWLFEPDSEILNSMFSTSPSGSSVASTVAVTTAIQTYQKEFRYDRFKKLLDFVGITNADVECVFVSRFPAAIMSTTTRLPRLSRSGSVSSEESWGTVSTTVGNCVDEGMFSAVRIGLKDLMMQDWLVHDCRDTHENDEDDDENEDIWPWESTVDDDVDGLIL